MRAITKGFLLEGTLIITNYKKCEEDQLEHIKVLIEDKMANCKKLS